MPSAKVVFGQYILELRTTKGISQEKLAELCGLNRNYLNRLEHGRTEPKLESILKLAYGLGVDHAHLLRPFRRWKPQT